MKPRIKVITLGVDDLQRSLAFYRDGLGLTTFEDSMPSIAEWFKQNPPQDAR